MKQIRIISWALLVGASMTASCLADPEMSDADAALEVDGIAQALVDTSAPTSLVAVQMDPSGVPVLRNVLSEVAYPNGAVVEQPQPIGFNSTSSFTTVNAPSALRYEGKLLVAQRTSSGTIVFNDSSYGTRLARDQDSPPPIRTVLSSDSFGSIATRVQLARSRSAIFITWRSGSTLRAIASKDAGQTWTAAYTLTTLSVSGEYAVASDLSGASDQIALVRVRTSGSTRFVEPYWLSNLSTAAQPVFGLASPSDLAPYSGTQAIAALGAAFNADNKLFVAFSTDTRMIVSRFSATRNIESSFVEFDYGTSDGRRVLNVAIQPSPYGWSLQWEELAPAGTQRSSPTELQSADGLSFYASTPVTRVLSAVALGPVTMTTTPVPLPWVWKYADSGRPANEVVNLVITGDGYTYAERNAFFGAAISTAEHLRQVSPITENGHLYNIYIMAAHSRESGSDRCAAPVRSVDTIFDSSNCDSVSPPGLYFRYAAERHARRMLSGLAAWDPAVRPIVRGIGLVNGEVNSQPGYTTWWGYPVATGGSADQSGHLTYNDPTTLHEALHGNLFAHPDYADRIYSADQEYYQDAGINLTSSHPISSSHAWSHWFTSAGTAPSVTAYLSDDYRAHRKLARVSCGSSYPATYAYFFADATCTTLETAGHPAVQPGATCQPVLTGPYNCIEMGHPDNTNPYYGAGATPITALSYFNPALFEQEEHNDSLFHPDWMTNPTRWFSPTLSGLMYSRVHGSYFLDPLTSEGIVESLERWRFGSYASAGFRNAGGATLAVHMQGNGGVKYGTLEPSTVNYFFPWGRQNGCPERAPTSTLDALGAQLEISVNGVPFGRNNLTLARWGEGSALVTSLGKLVLPDTAAGTSVEVTFRSTNTTPSAAPAYLWLPGIQILNQRGARYFLHPKSTHVTALQARRPGACNFEHWDLHSDGPFTVTFVSKGPRT